MPITLMPITFIICNSEYYTPMFSVYRNYTDWSSHPFSFWQGMLVKLLVVGFMSVLTSLYAICPEVYSELSNKHAANQAVMKRARRGLTQLTNSVGAFLDCLWSKDLSIALGSVEGDFLSLCTVTFWQICISYTWLPSVIFLVLDETSILTLDTWLKSKLRKKRCFDAIIINYTNWTHTDNY